METAAELRANGTQLNAENITKVVDAVLRFKNLGIAKAAYLVSNNIIPEEKSITSLNRFVEGRVRLSSELLDLASSLAEIQDKDVAFAILKSLMPWIILLKRAEKLLMSALPLFIMKTEKFITAKRIGILKGMWLKKVKRSIGAVSLNCPEMAI